MKVLVTGGAGYIGSHTCKRLSQNGFTPVVFDSLVYGHREAVRWGPFVQGNLHDTGELMAVMREHSIGAVVHFAAFAFVGESMQRPDIYYDNNVVGTLSLLQAMRSVGVSQLVFSSTAATYGVPQQSPIPETHPQLPVNPYGASKLMVERILQDYAAAFKLASVALRYFNAAGADAQGELGEDHTPETHLIPLALAAAQQKAEPLTVFGDDYPTPDGTCVRDYVHVTDLAQAHVAALRHMHTGAQGAMAYNLGNGQGFSVREVLAAAEQVTGRPVPHRMGPRRAGDPPVLVADSRKARQELQWEPQHASLHEIVATAWRWHQRQAKPSLHQEA